MSFSNEDQLFFLKYWPKKDFALHLEKCDVETFYRPILFAMWDGKPYEHIIWRIMKPKYEKPFKKDEN